MAAALLFAACNNRIAPSTTPVVNTEIINEKKQATLLGHCSYNILESENQKEWFTKNFSNYKVDTATALQLKPLLAGKTIEIFLGTWCGDSRREVPAMLKILETAGCDTNTIKLIFVHNADSVYKQSPQHEERGKFIHHVPTFIVYEGNKELNRIVETPIVSLEKDLLAVLNKTDYAPKYKALLAWKKEKHKSELMGNERLNTLVAKYKNLCLHAGEFNAYGYVLMSNKKMTEALNVFKLNVLLYNNNANIWDSLAECYYKMGNKAEAKKYYEKVLELNPKSENAKMMLEKLK